MKTHDRPGRDQLHQMLANKVLINHPSNKVLILHTTSTTNISSSNLVVQVQEDLLLVLAFMVLPRPVASMGILVCLLMAVPVALEVLVCLHMATHSLLAQAIHMDHIILKVVCSKVDLKDNMDHPNYRSNLDSNKQHKMDHPRQKDKQQVHRSLLHKICPSRLPWE
jgi:hypothetical protein